MKRDYDLIRLILIDVEKDVHDWSEDVRQRAEGKSEVISGHVELLVDHGEIKYPKDNAGRYQRAGNGYWLPFLCSLTMEGHDLLDNIRNPSTFQKLKQKIDKIGGQVSLEIFKTLAAETFKSAVGLS